MSLRWRLLLVSLLVLSLPLMGWQLVRHLEQSLRDSYQQTLIDVAVASARDLASSAERWPLESGIYVHEAGDQPRLDGYDSEWLKWRAHSSWHEAGGARLMAAEHAGRVYLLVEVPHSQQQPAGGERTPPALELRIESGGKTNGTTLRPAAPGWVEAADPGGRLRVQAVLRPGDRFWRFETALRHPERIDRLGVAVADGQTALPLQSLIRPRPAAGQELAERLPQRTRAWLLHPRGWVLARSGAATVADSSAPPEDGLDDELAELGARLLGVFPERAGNFEPDAARIAPSDVPAANSAEWFPSSAGAGFVIRATVPVEGQQGGEGPALLVVERPADRFMSEAYRALLQLFVLGLAAMLLIALVLIGFAGQLSRRIRRLRDDLECVTGDDGRMRAALPRPRGSDELADLGRSLSTMVDRQRRHQDYLRTLAEKLSHELRTPLAMIRSSLENLADSETEQQRERFRQRAQEGADRLQSIFRAMSQAARIEQSLDEEPKVPVDLARLVTAYVEGCRQTFTRHRFAAVVPGNAAVEIEAGPDQIGQLLDKLVENAVDFTPPGERITLRVMPRGQRVCLQVDNPGPSLPAETAERIFDSMVSLRSREEGRPHLGLGLHIARLIAERHGGSIRAVERAGGCRFEVEWPRRAPDARAQESR